MSILNTTIPINDFPMPVLIDFTYEPYDAPGQFDPGTPEGIDIKTVKTHDGETFPDWLHEALDPALIAAVWDHIYDEKQRN